MSPDAGSRPRRQRRSGSVRRPVDLGPGQEVGGFQIEALIGRGGMSTVYRAKQIRLQRAVALKVLLPILAADDQFVQRFRLEGVNAARLDHPDIVPVYEAGEDRGYVFIAMKLVEGVTLRDRLGDSEMALQVQEALTILGSVAQALDYAHGLGYVHRDVKPGNVLLSFDGHTYLSDFGLTKLLGRDPVITTTGQWLGTADYMAPEQARGGAVDHRADLYAFGCVVFECLTGSRPYVADDPIAVVFAHATREIPVASALNPDLPPSVDPVLARALAKAPEDRYGTAAALVRAVRGAVEEPRAPAAEPPRRPSSSSSRPPSARPPLQAVECPACRARLQSSDQSCASCGATLAWCTGCSRPMLSGDRFCQHCGQGSG